MTKIKVRVNEIIDKGKEGDVPSKIFDVTSIILIFLHKENRITFSMN